MASDTPTQILNSFGPVHGNVERQIIVTAPQGEAPATGGEESATDSRPAAAVKVRASVLLELMKRAGMGLDTKDRTKVCRLAAMVMGCDYKSLLNQVAEGIRLNARTHAEDVKQANRLLDDLEADFRLKF